MQENYRKYRYVKKTDPFLKKLQECNYYLVRIIELICEPFIYRKYIYGKTNILIMRDLFFIKKWIKENKFVYFLKVKKEKVCDVFSYIKNNDKSIICLPLLSDDLETGIIFRDADFEILNNLLINKETKVLFPFVKIDYKNNYEVFDFVKNEKNLKYLNFIGESDLNLFISIFLAYNIKFRLVKNYYGNYRVLFLNEVQEMGDNEEILLNVLDHYPNIEAYKKALMICKMEGNFNNYSDFLQPSNFPAFEKAFIHSSLIASQLELGKICANFGNKT